MNVLAELKKQMDDMKPRLIALEGAAGSEVTKKDMDDLRVVVDALAKAIPEVTKKDVDKLRMSVDILDQKVEGYSDALSDYRSVLEECRDAVSKLQEETKSTTMRRGRKPKST